MGVERLTFVIDAEGTLAKERKAASAWRHADDVLRRLPAGA